MDNQPELHLTYSGRKHVLRWGGMSTPFGRAHAGLMLQLGEKSHTARLHRVCGTFTSAGGWHIVRAPKTTHLVGFEVTSGGVFRTLEPGESFTLQRGGGQAKISLRHAGTTRSTHMSWVVLDRPGERRTLDLTPNGGLVTEPISNSDRGIEATIIDLAPVERQIMEIALRHQGPRVLQHATVGDQLDPPRTAKSVAHHVENVKDKVTRWCDDKEGEQFDSVVGLPNNVALAMWLASHGVISE